VCLLSGGGSWWCDDTVGEQSTRSGKYTVRARMYEENMVGPLALLVVEMGARGWAVELIYTFHGCHS
jgi:hypothetical protein